jgi:DNA-directed RNA polymerase specialized sigma24 family protein
MNEKLRNAPDDPDPFLLEIQCAEVRAELKRLAVRARILPDDREDIVSETISTAIRNRSKYEPQRASVMVWVLGIGKKVVATYFRKRRAKKRNPDGGVLSLDVSTNENSDSRYEPEDAALQMKHEASEQIQHYVDRAKLSEKEAKAIAQRLDKERPNMGQKCSSSTTHRAVQKLRQVVDDEKFREQPSETRLAECAYGTIPAAEHNIALLYDVLRQTSWFTDAIDRWRKSANWKEITTHLEAERKSGRFPLTILPRYWPEELHRFYRKTHERNPDSRRRFEGAVSIALAIPDWPILSYCCLDAAKRRPQLEEFGLMFGKEPFWEINERIFEIFVDAVERQPLPNLSAFLDMINKAPQNGSETYNSVHLIRIDWRFPLKTILTSFEKWAAGQKIRRGGGPKIQPTGRPRNRLLLGYAFSRLTSEFGLRKGAAISWLKESYGRPVPKSPERIYRAAKHARDTLEKFLPTPAEIGL